MDNIGPNQLKIQDLLKRVSGDEQINEIILANPDAEGEATSYYINKLLTPYEVKVTRIAMVFLWALSSNLSTRQP